MLALQLKDGEYLTIGDDIAVQVFQQSGPSFRVEVKAPRELPILRGTLRERSGGKRPDGLLDRRPAKPSERLHNARNLDEFVQRRAREASALREMEAILDRMEGREEAGPLRGELQALRAQLQRLCGAEDKPDFKQSAQAD